MSEQASLFVFKLRKNIALEGDLLLAYMELDSFLPGAVQNLDDIKSLIQQVPELANLKDFSALESNVRLNGKQGYTASGKIEILAHLIRRVSFIQHIYCITTFSEQAKIFLTEIINSLGEVITYQIYENILIIQAIPHYTLIELSKVVANQSNGIFDTKRNLDFLLNGLLNKTVDQKTTKLVNNALSAQLTTSHLSHDIHYYKAKFFPRMARSLLNICSQKLGEGQHRVLDNFVGSGTTLLEASLLGIPSVGLDIDPLSVMIAATKLQAISIESELLSKEVVCTLQSIENQIIESRFCDQSKLPESNIVFPTWLLKNRKMSIEIASELSREIHQIKTAIFNSDRRVQNLLNILLSDAISRKIKMRFMGTGVGRFSLTFAKSMLLDIFRKSLQQYVKVGAMCEWLEKTIHLHFTEAQVIAADARNIPNTLGLFDILITSPPYLPASSGRESYAKARALSLIALNLQSLEEVDSLVDDSIGSMNGGYIDINALSNIERDLVDWLSKDKLRNIKAEPTAKYFLDMKTSFAEMYRVLQPGGMAVVVSGKNSTFYEFSTRQPLYIVNVAEILASQAEKIGFEVDALHDIQLDKSNKNARPRSLDDYYETLIMLRKPAK